MNLLAAAMVHTLATTTPLASPPPATEISVLTYNVRGLPWPLAARRGAALRQIGEELAQMRREGRQPDVVLIQEGFRGEIVELVRASGYAHWAKGPDREAERPVDPSASPPAYDRVRYLGSGEGWGKLTGAGLHVLSDRPILDVRAEAFRYCAGLDCLANKGVLLARVALPDGGAVDIVTTHLNSKRAAKVPLERSLRAHNLQTEQLIAFIRDHRDPGSPLLVGGDFNVRNAPDRYYHQAAARPFMVVSEFCSREQQGCAGQSAAVEDQPWLRSQDLQAFDSSARVNVRPLRVETVFARASGGLSDHDGYMVRYRLDRQAADGGPPAIQVRPQVGTWGVKASWRY